MSSEDIREDIPSDNDDENDMSIQVQTKRNESKDIRRSSLITINREDINMNFYSRQNGTSATRANRSPSVERPKKTRKNPVAKVQANAAMLKTKKIEKQRNTAPTVSKVIQCILFYLFGYWSFTFS